MLSKMSKSTVAAGLLGSAAVASVEAFTTATGPAQRAPSSSLRGTAAQQQQASASSWGVPMAASIASVAVAGMASSASRQSGSSSRASMTVRNFSKESQL
eukprot:CAMPEP_0178401544 /NCGR_PEP_ID=MMETSP0689_2-20121128/16358_1 /TAXON_ID=160604 /ORGANISM="Amphidinium massartii, Strain CS-259" /LENGTH=99 /DNA_ID=CAMNT_0020022371 /DNA_START=80 /DNA_END=376 /DNA_ORIENTATION=+